MWACGCCKVMAPAGLFRALHSHNPDGYSDIVGILPTFSTLRFGRRKTNIHRMFCALISLRVMNPSCYMHASMRNSLDYDSGAIKRWRSVIRPPEREIMNVCKLPGL